jgi:hypothetical protein
MRCWNVQQIAQIGERGFVDRHEFSTAVTHFHDTHATTLPVEHLIGRLKQHIFGHRRWASRKIKYTHLEAPKKGGLPSQ